MTYNDYDVFISFKNTDENGNPTKDREIAAEIYRYLENEGLSVFFSNEDIKNGNDTNYSRVIYHALDTAQLLIVVGTTRQYIESEWVMNEWETFLGELNAQRKVGSIINVGYDTPIQEIPLQLRKFQQFNLSESDALTKLSVMVFNILKKKPIRPESITLGGKTINTRSEEIELKNKRISTIADLSWCLELVRLELSYNLITDLTPIENLTALRFLSLRGNKISNLFPLQRLINLETLSLYDNSVEDISPISSLTHLSSLLLNDNNISNLSSLTGLIRLKSLHASNNNITSIGTLGGLTNLCELGLSNNHIHDISSLRSLTNLTKLYLDGNPISNIDVILNLQNLKMLSIDKKTCNDEFLREFKARIPHCIVTIV